MNYLTQIIKQYFHYNKTIFISPGVNVVSKLKDVVSI